MPDTYKKENSSEVVSSNPELVVEDAWKDIRVKKEHQPEIEKSNLTYRDMEQQIVSIDRNLTKLTNQKTAMEAEMIEVKTAAEA
jgi:hypothetical protein